MKVNILKKGNIELNSDTRAYVEDKLKSVREKYLKNYQDDELFFEVEIVEGEKEKERRFRVDFSVSMPGDRIHAVGWGETIQAAADEAKDELSRRIRREKEKRLALLKRAGRKIKDILRFGR